MGNENMLKGYWALLTGMAIIDLHISIARLLTLTGTDHFRISFGLF
jgi:hypothetical protein